MRFPVTAVRLLFMVWWFGKVNWFGSKWCFKPYPIRASAV